ncbi:potassium channel family protein [Pseudokineococcus lusitanus]|uniref:Trk system potassium uptake protein TrkA n=1 Tax=Pseudokineococcus lusitanus TaxID=763993 RepID=A0A3N1G8U8_9ACTN|nr:TrkA family potassium uptake protein [Pseudokineococcus lusitanus]ROP26669.1 trk system potassium uptake protein TrkA [Pseudokineococcus lusitanus]
MRVLIAGAGSVGRSIARELLASGHDVLLVDKNPDNVGRASVPGARWLLADACEIGSLGEAGLESTDVVVAATGDDKANLVVSLLAKTEFGVPRTVARVNNPKNEWMFDEAWGVDVMVSTPRLMTALVEEAVAVGDVVEVFSFRGGSRLVGYTLPDDADLAGTPVGAMTWPPDTVLVGLVRDGRPLAPSEDDVLEGRDELLLLVGEEDAEQLHALLRTGRHAQGTAGA